MQPKRDPNDRRYWPLALGGTGTGFTGRDRKNHKQRYCALRGRRDRDRMTQPSIDEIRQGKTPEAIRLRARLVLDRALDRVEEELEGESVTLQALSATVGALGRIAGVQSTDVNVGGSVAHLHLDALRVRNSVNSLNVNNLTNVNLLNSGEERNTVDTTPRSIDATYSIDATP